MVGSLIFKFVHYLYIKLYSEYEYKKFLDEYSQFNVKKSIPFESLVKELEEKRKRLAEGNLQPTPLLEYLVEQELKKVTIYDDIFFINKIFAKKQD
jgi:hypothetical protein